MRFRFMRDDGNSSNNGWAHFRISMLSLLAVVVYVLVGAGAFLWLNPTYTSQGIDQEFETTFLDATYFTTVTITTVGFGDIVPNTEGAKLFLALYILLSLVLVGVMLEVTDFLFQIDIEELQDEAEKQDVGKFWTRPRRKLAFSVLLVLLAMSASTLFYVLHEDFTFIDAFYFSVATMTTVGYGDYTPTTQEGRLFAVFWIGIGCLALFRAVGALMDVMLESRKSEWRKQRDARVAMLERHLSARISAMSPGSAASSAELLSTSSHAELIQVITKLEFMLHRMQTSGKLTSEDLQQLEAEYKSLSPEDLVKEYKGNIHSIP